MTDTHTPHTHTHTHTHNVYIATQLAQYTAISYQCRGRCVKKIVHKFSTHSTNKATNIGRPRHVRTSANKLTQYFIYWRSYCQPYEASPMKFASFSRTMHWLIVHVKQWNCIVVRNSNSLLPTSGCPTARTKTADYCIWGVMQQRIYHMPIRTADITALSMLRCSKGGDARTALL